MAAHMARNVGGSGLALALLLLGCCACWVRTAAAVEAFSYGELSGPAEWDGTCAAGKEQSPLDISTDAVKSRGPSGGLEFDYGRLRNATIYNTGFGPQVQMPAGNILTTDGGQQWQLLQLHFHTPSENAFDGRHAAMEAHLVHKNIKTGELAVVGVMLEDECPPASSGRYRQQWCSALQQAMDLMPEDTGKESEPHNLHPDTFTSLLPGAPQHRGRKNRRNKRRHSHRHSYPHASFDGSLTIPPCTEGLSWYVLLEPSPVGASQVLRFQRVVGQGKTLASNARPVQPYNGRTMTFGG